jgi:ABC-type bacteriocin/lantibiotic exporter with double-glycine peptidase domain
MSFNNLSIKLNPFTQTPGFCGPACLKMILEYYGIFVSEEEIAKISFASKENGTSLNGIVKAAKHFGFKVFLKDESSLDDLKYFIIRQIPIIVDWFCEDDGHYSIVTGINDNKILFIDPGFQEDSLKEREMSVEKFLRVWFDFPGEFIKKKKELILRRMIILTPFKERFPIRGGSIK